MWNEEVKTFCFCLVDSVQKPKSPVPIPFQLGRYVDDPSFQHEDFNGFSVGTLRARVRKGLKIKDTAV